MYAFIYAADIACSGQHLSRGKANTTHPGESMDWRAPSQLRALPVSHLCMRTVDTSHEALPTPSKHLSRPLSGRVGWGPQPSFPSQGAPKSHHQRCCPSKERGTRTGPVGWCWRAHPGPSRDFGKAGSHTRGCRGLPRQPTSLPPGHNLQEHRGRKPQTGGSRVTNSVSWPVQQQQQKQKLLLP